MDADGMGLQPPTDPDGATVAAEPPTTPPSAEALRFTPSVAPTFERGDQVGRYMVLDLLGAGAMGAVYRAYDPELNREVALKLLLPMAGTEESLAEARLRMQREAQSMAKLAHPNVIGVFDVGTHAQDVFFTMELISGPDLAKWLRDAGRPRPWREVVDVFLQAGEGLAAAHDAGVVHRDFKPSNVLVGDDGRVRVLDFGIARTEEEEEMDLEATDPGETALLRRENMIEGTITRAGTVVGTPAYMSPEQHRGKATDARADQYAFCVALYEALYGRRPFRGRDFRELGQAKVRGDFAEPEDTDVPAWLRKLVRKGLAPKPADRHADMRTLLAELVRDRGKRRRRWLGVAAISGALGIGAGVMDYVSRDEGGGVCGEARHKISSVWSDKVKDDLRQAFTATGLRYAPGSWDAAEGALDTYSRDWTRMHVEACEATKVRGEQSQELFDARIACLDSHLNDLRALVAVFGEPDERIVRQGPTLARGLPDLSECVNPSLERIRMPDDVRDRIRYNELRGSLARARTLREAGKVDAAMEIVAAVEAGAAELEYEPLRAEVLYEKGRLMHRLGDASAAEEALYEAAWSAQRSLHDQVEAEAWIALVYVVGFVQARYEDGHWLGRQAGATLEALGGRPDLRAELSSNLGAVRHKAGDYDQALAQHQEALDLRTKLFGEEDTRVAESANDVGVVLRLLGRYDEAGRFHERARAIEDTLGPGHPGQVKTLGAMGELLFAQGRHEEAREKFQRAFEIADDILGTDHPERAVVLTNLGAVAGVMGQRTEAETHYRNALALRERVLGQEHPDVGTSLENLAGAVAADGRHEEALAYLRRGLALKRAGLGERHPEVATSLHLIARSLLGLGKAREATDHLTRALEIIEERMGPDHPEAATILVALGEANLALGRRADAATFLDRAVGLLESRGVRPTALARARFLLARALWPSDRARALALATEARTGYGALGEEGKADLDAVAEWLAPRTAIAGGE